ncbi:hypothetical protein ACJMK2_006462, partial [Sinanodonta woodiana]
FQREENGSETNDHVLYPDVSPRRRRKTKRRSEKAMYRSPDTKTVCSQTKTSELGSDQRLFIT